MNRLEFELTYYQMMLPVTENEETRKAITDKINKILVEIEGGIPE